MEDGAAGIDALPRDLLIKILRRLPSFDRRCVLPLVCQRWRALASGPSQLWESLALEMYRQPRIGLSGMVLAADWITPRAAALCNLHIWLEPHLSAFPAIVVGAIARAGGEPVLERLIVNFDISPLPPPGIGWKRLDVHSFDTGEARAAASLLHSLGSETRVGRNLELLGLESIRGPLHEEYISAPLQLPRLRCFRLNFESFRVVVEDPFAWLPRGLPSFLMNCLALEELVVTCAGDASLRELPSSLGKLQRLRKLVLLQSGVTALPEALSSLSGLQSLQVVAMLPHVRVAAPVALDSLGQLTHVELSSEGLPLAALGGVSGLRRLVLWGIDDCSGPDKDAELEQLLGGLQLQELGLPFCHLLELPAAVTRHASLRSLDLRDCRLSELPPGPYLQQLTRLDLRNNRFRTVPAAALEAPRMESLLLVDNTRDLNPHRPRNGDLTEVLEEFNERLERLHDALDEWEEERFSARYQVAGDQLARENISSFKTARRC